MADKHINEEAFSLTMQNIWKMKDKVTCKEVGFNLFLIEFQEVLDLQKIQEGRPWSFDRFLLSHTKYERHLSMQIVEFKTEPM